MVASSQTACPSETTGLSSFFRIHRKGRHSNPCPQGIKELEAQRAERKLSDAATGGLSPGSLRLFAALFVLAGTPAASFTYALF